MAEDNCGTVEGLNLSKDVWDNYLIRAGNSSIRIASSVSLESLNP